jgi:uncharacterized protein with PIN domain
MTEPVYTGCNVRRKAIASEPVTNWYQISFYKCPRCNAVLRLVERKEPPSKNFVSSRLRRRKRVN